MRTAVRTTGNIYRFADFEFLPDVPELRKFGLRVKLEQKPLLVLEALLERSGQLVARSELQKRLWPANTFVDFELGLNVAVRKLRAALGDSAEESRFVETLAGTGYRFIAAVEFIVAPVAPKFVVPPVPEASFAEQRQPSIESGPSQHEVELAAPRADASTAHPHRRWWLFAAGMVAVVALAVGWNWFFRPAPLLKDSGWVLIADFDNRTGDKALDGTLEYALERELSNSQFVYVVPRERVQDSLRLMKKPLDSKLDRVTAREVCLRDGAIKAILTGRVEKIGTNYVLSVEIVDPVRDVAVAGMSEEDPADTLLADAVRRLATHVREKLGESTQLVRASNGDLEKVTTPSLRALELYTQADRTFRQFSDDSNQIAAELLEQALKEDPDFASAHVLLGYAYSNQGKTRDAEAHFRRAFELADKTTERERYFILASYYGSHPINQPEKAAELYETLLRRYPVQGWQLSILAGIYNRLHRPDKLDDLSVRAADLRPNDPRAQVLAAWNLAVREIRQAAGNNGNTSQSQPDFTQPDHYLARAIALRDSRSLDEPETDVSVRTYAAQIHWMEGRFSESRSDALEAEQVDKIKPSEMALYYAAFGSLHEAEKRLDRDPMPVEQAMLAYYRGDVDSARGFLRGTRVAAYSPFVGAAAVLMVHTGLLRDAEAIRRDELAQVNKFPWRTGDAVVLHIIEGELAFARGKSAKGTAILENTLAEAPNPSYICNLMASDDLAQTYRQQGRLEDAIRVLARAVAGPVWPNNFSAAWQQRLLLHLAQLYRESGRGQDADRILHKLATELAFADPDHPIIRQLAAFSKPSASVAVKIAPVS